MKKTKLLMALLVCTAISLQANAEDFSGSWSGQFNDVSTGGVGGVFSQGTDNPETWNFIDSTFTDNHAYYDGGAGGNYGKMTVLNSTFTGNTAQLTKDSEGNFTVGVTDSTPIGGGALSLGAVSTTRIENSTFRDNISGKTGGAIGTRLGTHANNSGAKLDIINSTFEGNKAHTNGGAIYGSLYNSETNEGAITISANQFINNNAGNNGGAIYLEGGTDKSGGAASMIIANSEFRGNTASANGGSIYNDSSMIVGGNFSDSSAKQGGAIYNAKDLTVLDGSTFSNNSATVTGSAISNYAEKLVIGDNVKFSNNTCLMENPSEVSPMTQMGTIYSEGTADRQNNITIGNNVTFENNKSGAGSGMYLFGNNKVTVGDNAQFINNTTQKSLTDTTPTSGGGAITLVSGSNGAASLEIGDNARFEGNKALYAGAINVNSADSSLIIGEAAQFINNKAEGNVGGAIYNNGNTTIAKGATFTGNSALAGGAIFTTKDIELTDATFSNNLADKQGGAIYTSSDNLILNAVDKDVVMTGNKAANGGDIFMSKEGSNLNLNAQEGKSITVASGISGNANGYNVLVNSNGGTGSLIVNSAIQNAAIDVQNGTFQLGQNAVLVDSDLTMATGSTFNSINGRIDSADNIARGDSSVTFADGTNIAADVNISNGTADNFVGADIQGKVTLTDIKTLGNTTANSVSINLAEVLGIDPNKLAISEALQNQTQRVLTPIRYLQGGISETGMLTMAPTGNSYKDFNPAVMASPVAAQLGGYLTQLNSYDQAFRNMDMYMLMTRKQREAMKLRNKYAAADSNLIFDPTGSAYDDKAVWVRPYATFENVPLKGGPRVSNVAYGSFFGADSELYDLGHGWDGMLSVYAGYNGSHQAYDGIGIYQNGGTLGITGMAYKGNFFTGLTLNAGANVGEANTAYGNDNFTMLMAGIANKTGYNIELADGKFIIQPNVQLSYSFVNTFDYTNAAGVKMNSDPLNAIQVEPGIKFIGNLKNGWQPYAGVSVVWNIMDKTNFHANNVSLPELSVKPYVRYGVGVRKTWGEVCTGFLQTYFTNGGRNGVGIQGGFRFTLGKGGLASLKTSNNMPELPKTQINLSSAR